MSSPGCWTVESWPNAERSLCLGRTGRCVGSQPPPDRRLYARTCYRIGSSRCGVKKVWAGSIAPPLWTIMTPLRLPDGLRRGFRVPGTTHSPSVPSEHRATRLAGRDYTCRVLTGRHRSSVRGLILFFVFSLAVLSSSLWVMSNKEVFVLPALSNRANSETALLQRNTSPVNVAPKEF
jgi:hypothetical protein